MLVYITYNVFIRFVILIPIEWLFIVTAFLVQMVHGLGTSMFYTTIYTLISTIFLDSVGTVMVRAKGDYS